MLALSTEKSESPKGLLSNLLGLKAGVKGAEDDKFSLLLKSFALGKTDTKDFLFANDKGLKLDTLDTDLLLVEKIEEPSKSKNTKLLSLFALGNEEATDEEQLHTDILKAIPLKDAKQSIQTLIGEAKSYLKEQVSQKVDVKELPKTLGGLIKLAEKSGIDIKAINFESLSKQAFPQELSQALTLAKPQTPLPYATSQLVQPPVKTEKEPVQKPLVALLNKADGLALKTTEVSVNALSTQAPVQEPKTLSSSIQSLLHGESDTETPEGIKEQEKPQVVTQAKHEVLSQKITEAKQLIQTVSQSVRESVENYKPPFTRIKMQLNPQKFGDMEVTLIQRGNNVHININANTNALTVMMQNAHELKAQLNSQGLGDASMNFSSHQQEQQEQKQKQEEAGLAYEDYQDFEEEFTEVATALEIVVPRYI